MWSYKAMTIEKDGDFTLRSCNNIERFRFAMRKEIMFIRVAQQRSAGDRDFIFIADRSDAIALRDWLNTNLSE